VILAVASKHVEGVELRLLIAIARVQRGEIGDDVWIEQLSLRKANLDRLLSRQVGGIFMADYEQRAIGHDLFHAACRMGLEGIVSKHRGRAYRSGRCRHWIKVKNRALPAYSRVADLHWAARRLNGSIQARWSAIRCYIRTASASSSHSLNRSCRVAKLVEIPR
jgi:hypothetical protein